MSRALSVVLAVCCVLSMGVAGLPATDSPSTATVASQQSASCSNDDPNVVCVPNASNYLALNGSDVVAVSENDSSLDVSTAVATDVSSLTMQLSAEAMENEYDDTPRESRRALLERYTRELGNRTADLRAQERAALRRYNNGIITGDEYLRTLAEIDARADRLWGLTGFVDNRWRIVTGQANRDPSASIRADLMGLRGPLRDRLQSTYAGDRQPLRVHITTTDDGLALGAFVEDNGRQTYVRDTYLGDVRRRSSGTDLYGGNTVRASNRIAELYPWASEQSGLTVNGETNAYRSPKYHAHGSTTVYLDGESGQVFAEHRRSYLDRIPVSYTNASNESLTVTLGQTHRGGPLNVTVTDDTGSRVPATVTVNGRPAGETGDDGTLWTVTPYSARTLVEAEYDGQTVTIVRYPTR
ncbi:hypothetical protein ACFPYI_09215 [Halomarina salina]|uniref:Uncharacterized protein n=1 Tax=Halomarina salina TaxID=1872699 RepID=A0ABD5RLR3_9EURY|nr:hypothetical protein [Halomarina salina]